MTFEEYAKERKIIGGSWYVEIMMAWNAATLAERDACANIAINGCLVPPDGGSPSKEEIEMCDGIAAAIRARSTS